VCDDEDTSCAFMHTTIADTLLCCAQHITSSRSGTLARRLEQGHILGLVMLLSHHKVVPAVAVAVSLKSGFGG
jgi:hypothetical protein